MLEADELAEIAASYGVPETQVRRDHLISHLLAAVATLDLPLTFFGGTALARTYLSEPAVGARLSEDIDLYGPQRRELAKTIDERLPRLVRREFPGLRWDRPLATVRGAEPGSLVSPDGLRVQVQVLDSAGDHHDYARWPTEIRPVDLRYRDTPGSVALRVPTLTAAAAMKTLAWMDRQTARDLYDLAGLARIGALTVETATLVHEISGWRVASHVFASLPKLDWQGQLGHQTGVLPSAASCIAEVRTAYARALDWRVENHDTT